MIYSITSTSSATFPLLQLLSGPPNVGLGCVKCNVPSVPAVPPWLLPHPQFPPSLLFCSPVYLLLFSHCRPSSWAAESRLAPRGRSAVSWMDDKLASFVWGCEEGCLVGSVETEMLASCGIGKITGVNIYNKHILESSIYIYILYITG